MLTSLILTAAVTVGVVLGSLVSPLAAALTGAVVAFSGIEVTRRTMRHRGVAAAPQDSVTELRSTLSEAEMLTLLSRANDAVIVLDPQQTVVFANTAARLLLAPGGEGVEGRPLLRAAWSGELTRLASAATGVPQELAFTDGRTLLAVAVTLSTASARTGLILTEISATRRAERSRSELAANLSHELRTPIAAARALAETLEGGVDDPVRRERYQLQLIAEIDRLTAIVERSLRLSRIEAGAEVLELAPVDVAVLLQVARQRVAPLVEAADLVLEVSEEPGLRQVLADLDRVTEVLTILLDNAVKFSPPASLISLRAFATPADPTVVTIEVRDRGPGVLPSERERIFERLYTGDPSRTIRAGDRQGFGLGLAIARHIVARHGGRIWVEEGAGPGATFRFTLPAAATASREI